MELSTLAPGIGERAAIVGNSGSGKSTLARFIALEMAKRQPLLIIDPKGEVDTFKGRETLIERPQDKVKGSVIRYVPKITANVAQEVDTILTSCYHAGNMAIWIDELYPCVEGMAVTDLIGLRAILTRGRSKKITFMGLAQRPAWIPLFVLSEANKKFVFCLPLQDDRDRMAKIIGNELIYKVLPKYQFWYAETDQVGEVSGPLTLEI